MSCIVEKMPHIWRVWCHIKNACDIVYTVGLRTQIVAVMSHVYVALHTGCAFIYSGFDVISTVGWWHNDWMWCSISGIGCHTEGGCDVIQKWVWYQCRGCDEKDTVGAISDTGVWCDAWSGCDNINSIVWSDRVDAMSSAVQRMSNICRVWWHQHRVLWCHT